MKHITKHTHTHSNPTTTTTINILNSIKEEIIKTFKSNQIIFQN
jgi:hypothetical protein